MEHNRRKGDKSVLLLQKLVDKNTGELKDLNFALRLHMEQETKEVNRLRETIMGTNDRSEYTMEEVKKLRSEVYPVLEIMHDVAAVGRLGQKIKKIAVWAATIGAALVAYYHVVETYMKGIGK